ncbi:MAG: LPS assembly protein LptD, partial [Desulfobacterales bacterium]
STAADRPPAAAGRAVGRTALARLCIFLSTCLCLVLAGGTGAAQDFQGFLNRLNRDDTQLPWTIDADTLSFDEMAQRYVAEGHVVITKGDRVITADRVEFDKANVTARAEGHVKVTTGGDFLTGSRVELDLEQKTGIVYDGSIFLRKNNFHITGKKILKTGETTYKIENAGVTTCDGEQPDWIIHGKKIDVTLEGYGIVKGATLRAGGVPVLYSPYLVFPANTDRQTGLLAPQLGTSTRWGFFVNQPFYWAIGDSSDATFYDLYMSERGNKIGAEYRYALSETGKGAWMVDYFNDRKVDDGIGDNSEKWGYTGDAFLRPNRDRYWVRGGHYFTTPADWRGRLEVDFVSDQDYLTEFRNGYSGYNATNAYFLSMFARQLDDYTDPLRLNRFVLSRTWSRFNLDINFQWTDDVIKRRFAENDDTLQRLPAVSFYGVKQRLLSSDLFFDLISSYNYFYRQAGETGQRLDVYPRFYWPSRWSRYVSLEPSIGLRQTLWWTDPTSDDGRFSDRQLWDARVEMKSDLYNIFAVDRLGFDKIKHIVRPTIVYQYVPDVGQNDLPDFDFIDRIAATNLVTYSLNNFFITRSSTPGAADAAGTGMPPHDYREIVRFNVEQSYYFDPATREDATEAEKEQSFSPIGAELDIWLSPYVALDTRTSWNVYDYRLDSTSVSMLLSDTRGDRLSAGYSFTRDNVQSIATDLLVNWNTYLATGFLYEKNIRTNQRLQAGVSMLYRAGCWGIQVSYLEEPSDRKIEFAVNLLGLGEFKTSY